MSKFMVWINPSGAMRFADLASGPDGEHRAYETVQDPGCALVLRDYYAPGFDPTGPFAMRQHFGRSGFELMGHFIVPPHLSAYDALSKFAVLVLQGVRTSSPFFDDRNRVVFRKSVTFLATKGSLDLSLPAGLLGPDDTSARYNF